MINVKLTVIAGGGAALLSFIIGILSDVTAGALFMRALLSGLLFGGFSVLARILAGKFLPELFEEQAVADESEELEQSETGGNVNIVLDGEEDLSGAGTGIEYPAGVGETSGDSAFNEAVPASSGETAVQGGGADEPAFTAAASDVETAEEIEEVEEVEELGSPVSSGEAVPDIGEFENTFNAATPGLDKISSESESMSSISGSGSFEVLGGTHDPAEAAQAIQTILKKEQEG